MLREILERVAPDMRVTEVHGQLPGTLLEDRILEFRRMESECLLSTTVIENGVNFLRANTIIIE